MAAINYVELPSGDHPATRAFYANIFGWEMVDYGPTYACTTDQPTNLGLQGNPDAAPRAPLPVIAVADLEATLAAVEAAGCKITVPIFSFPGGRRFQFRDPSGNELAVWVETA